MTLSVDHASETGSAIKTGRRSPCMLRKLDGAVSVGRELRRDVGHQGNFSSFQSKAEVKMEDTKLVLGGADEPKVHGKIYEYYVESSSQSFPCIESISRPKRLTCGGSMTLKPQHVTAVGSSNNDYPRSPTSTLIMQDLALSQDSAEDAHSPVSPEPTSFSEPIRGLIRKDSYLTAAKNSVSEHAPVRHTMPGKNTSSPRETNEPSLETVAGAKFVHFPPENLGSYSLDNLKGKLHLGNCLEALSLAKMHGHASLQQACLRVMSDNYLQVLRDPGLYGRLMAGEREQIQKLRMKGKKCLMVADMDSPDWSRHQSRTKDPSNPNASSGLYYYDDYKDTWHLQCDIPQEVLSVGSAVCTMDNYLFVAVGCQRSDRDSVPSRRVFSYNPMTSIWNEICPMNEARPHCKLVALQGYVYAIGGECLSTVERYDPRTNRWLFVAPLPNDTFAVAHRATACNGELFVSGGTLRYTLLRYSPKTNTWRKSLIVGTKERTTEMVAVRNFLYRFDVSPSFGINVYRYHTVARLWYECCAKRLAHCPAFQCVTMDEVIYCVSRQFTMRFLADEVSPCFVAEDLSVLVTAKGILFPFVLTLPEESTLQTSV
uniref:Kelch domain-containing protein 7A n=2 Tax=Denticeps clupeoides TaxID=299321 RepID=A0AAY4EQP0_9TELE